MSHNDWNHVFAVIVLIGAAIIFVIDMGTQYGMKFAIKAHWTLGWYAARYITIGAAIMLALDVLY